MTEPSPSEDLLWLAKKLSGILSLIPVLEEYRDVSQASQGILRKAEEARQEVLALQQQEAALYDSLKALKGTLKERTSEISKEYEAEKARLKEELDEVRKHHQVQLDAQVAESTRRKLKVEALIEERQGKLKDIAAQENELLGRLHEAKTQLADIQQQLLAIKSKF